MQHTGPAECFPTERARFVLKIYEAAFCPETAAPADRQCRLTRQLAGDYFDARKVVRAFWKTV
jgi:hypothetical protein